MDRPTRRKARLALAIVAALVALPVPVAGAAAPADDEYVLEVPGATQADTGARQIPTRPGDATGPTAAGSGIQRGVVGETDAQPTPLAAAADALAAIPASLLIGAVLLLATVLVGAGVRRHRAPGGC